MKTYCDNLVPVTYASKFNSTDILVLFFDMFENQHTISDNLVAEGELEEVAEGFALEEKQIRDLDELNQMTITLLNISRESSMLLLTSSVFFFSSREILW